jgi:hypothetical protein
MTDDTDDVVYIVCYREWQSLSFHTSVKGITDKYITHYLEIADIDESEYIEFQKDNDAFSFMWDDFIDYVDDSYIIIKARMNDEIDVTDIYRSTYNGYEVVKLRDLLRS